MVRASDLEQTGGRTVSVIKIYWFHSSMAGEYKSGGIREYSNPVLEDQIFSVCKGGRLF